MREKKNAQFCNRMKLILCKFDMKIFLFYFSMFFFFNFKNLLDFYHRHLAGCSFHIKE